MVWLYALTLAAWLTVAIYMSPAVWSIYIAQGRRGDPARLNCLLFALLQIGGLSRRLLIGEIAYDAAITIILISSIAVAVLTLQLARSYGRGARV